MKPLIRRLTALLAAVLLAASLTGSCFATVSYDHFTDVPETAWYADAVYDVYLSGVMTGTGPAAFSPKGTMTRAMFVTALYRIATNPYYMLFFETTHDPEDAPAFPDVPSGAWYAEAVRWARSLGIVTGTPAGYFSPKAPITRQDAAVMLQRWLETTDLPLPECADCLDSVYGDAGEISPYAARSVQLIYDMGLMKGYADGCFRPKAPMTRAEAAAVFSWLLWLLNPNQTPAPA